MQRLLYAVIALIVSVQLVVATVVFVRDHRAQRVAQSVGSSAFPGLTALPTAQAVTAVSPAIGPFATLPALPPLTRPTASVAGTPDLVAVASPAPTPAPSAAPANAPVAGTPAAGVASPAISARAIGPTAVATAPAEPSRYTVRPGDSLTLLAQRFAVPEPILAALNDLDPTARLVVGQLLYVPAQGVVGDK